MKWTQFTSARLLLASPVLAIAAGGVADKPLYRAPVCDGAADQVKGGHPDVVVSGGRAFLFYFTHPGRRGPDANQNGYEQKRSSIQMVERRENAGWLACDRDEPPHIRLLPAT
jgi:hypothetical protein